jgi:DNA (cytosine-5)-methyltransferase 1
MKHFGNVCNIDGKSVDPVDIITFGAPCQDLSVAGKRSGMKHEVLGDNETTRSGLFFEAIRIIKEMRESTNGEYPKYAVYENVPGAFSSNKGRDFHAVLEALCAVCDDAVSIPEPYDKKRTKLVWNKAGEVVGDNYSVAWRTLDAQYWGVPQRRKRIYLVADFTGRCAGEILFKPESLRGDLSQGDETGQGVTADAVGGVDGGVGVGINGNIAGTLDANYFKGCGLRQGVEREVVVECLVLKERAGCEGGGKGALWSDKAFTLATNQDMSVIALQANGIDRADTAGCNGSGWRENESYTLNTIDRHAVCYGIDHVITTGGNCTAQGDCVYDNIQATLKAGGVHAVVQETYQAKTGPLMANSHPGSYTGQDAYSDMLVAGKAPKPPRKYIIRRLTPTECARLQGFPDTWGHLAPYDPADADFWEQVRKTHAEINGKKYKPVKDIKKWYDKLHTDSAEYKMWGNGIALPNAEYVIHGIAEQGAKTLGSLFDGSGGFPLAGALNGIKPLWSSEIEPYPIAVTKSRFKEVHNG